MSKWKPTDEQRDILEALRTEASKEESAAQFCRDFATFTESKFSKIMAAIDDTKDKSYFDEVKDKNGLMQDLTDLVNKLPQLRRERELASNNPLHKLSVFRAVAVSVRECKNKLNPERITKFISPTGGGKTSLRNFLLAEFRTELLPAAVECREAWRPATRDHKVSAKRAVLFDICSALGMRISDTLRREGIVAIEDALTNFCIETRRLLFIDEAEFFSAYALNLIKMLLNKTRLVVVIACTPRAHAKWHQYYPDEADQIDRRTHALVQVSSISPTDVALFFPAEQFVKPEDSFGYIATKASEFGHFSMVARTAEILKRSARTEKKELESAVAKALLQMGRNTNAQRTLN